MTDFIKPARGKRRLYDIAALPCIDIGSEIKYFGSISKCGDNADWDWGMFQDENGEWVLAEADGAGCIFNFTQHRYPTSAVPTFRFYFDNSSTPQFEITPAEFGKKAPFISPLADIFEGPEDNGRGPIWIVRSFVPMEFRTHCKVTSTIKLEGADKSLGQGGWGHITMQLYDSSDGLQTFSPNESIEKLIQLYKKPIRLPCDGIHRSEITLTAGESRKIFEAENCSTLVRLSAKVNDFQTEMLDDLIICICFDGKQTVLAPFGTFFGCEYGKTAARLDTALLTCDISGETAFFDNRYPMPFFESATISVENRCKNSVTLPEFEISECTSLRYNKKEIGCFTSSEYYPKTPNLQGKNSIIADISGHGQMVYGVITGEDIECGCEGDVRIFIDSLSSPAVESDGSESWGSYGWGFVCPPQCNPFSAYNGVPDSNNTWSELRLTFTDSYPFRSRMRFELEHGCQNDGGGAHSGQIFCYMKNFEREKMALEITPESEYYITDGDISQLTDRFENGIHENYETFMLNRNMTFSRFKVTLPAENRGIVLKRVSVQQNGRMAARVLIDGIEVCERNWLYPDFNDCYRLLEDSFTVPSHYTAAKEEITVEIRPLDTNWNECQYKIFVITD